MPNEFAPNRELSVSVSAFDEQMAFVSRHFNCLSLPEAIAQLSRGRLPERSLIVTFDDGYLDNLTLALPILRRHAVPATIYIATGLINRARLPWWYELEALIAASESLHFHWHQQDFNIPSADITSKRWAFDRLNPMIKRMEPSEQASFMKVLRHASIAGIEQNNELMTHRQLLELATDPLITVGAHTHNHLALRGLNPIRLHHEIVRAKTLLEQWIQQPVEHLAYPFGGRLQASTREFKAAADLGFSSAVTTRLGHFQHFHSKNLLALPRIGIGYRDCMARFEWKLSGWYCLARRPVSRLTC